MSASPIYYRRNISGPTDVVGWIVYAVFPDAPAPSPNLVAAVGAFPNGYRPTDRAGEVLRDDANAMQFWTCDVERGQMRRYLPLTEREAFILYPRLRHFVELAQRSLVETGDLPPGVRPTS